MNVYAKFIKGQYVLISGTATGYGDLIGEILSVELSKILGQPYYHVKVYSPYISTIFVSEQFIKTLELEWFRKMKAIENDPLHSPDFWE